MRTQYLESIERRCMFAVVVPAGFTDELYENGLTNATAMEFAPDGRLFVVRGRAPVMEAVLVRNGVNAPRIESLFETDLPYLAGAAPVPAFTF